MAVALRNTEITRDDVQGWIKDHKRASNLPSFNDDLAVFLRKKLKDKGKEGMGVNTSGSDSLEDETDLIDLILEDLPSYG